MSLRVLASRAVGGDPDGDHARLAETLRERVPAVRWVASYRTRGGSFDFVDVLEVDAEDDADARAVAQGVDGLDVEWAEAEA